MQAEFTTGDHDRLIENDLRVERDRILGGFHTPHDGLAKALRAAEAQARRAEARGATLRPHTEVLGILEHGGRVIGVHTADGVIDADIVVCAAGFWCAQLARQVGLVLPLVPMAHQYARTGQLAELVGRNSEGPERQFYSQISFPFYK